MSDQNERSILFEKGPTFYSQTDEDHFFAWLQSIPAVKQVRGSGLVLEVIVGQPMNKESLRDLIAVMVRYRMDCRPLKTLCDAYPDGYFRREGTYWHASVYG